MGHHARGVTGGTRDARHRRLVETVRGDDPAGDESDFLTALVVIDDLWHDDPLTFGARA